MIFYSFFIVFLANDGLISKGNNPKLALLLGLPVPHSQTERAIHEILIYQIVSEEALECL